MLVLLRVRVVAQVGKRWWPLQGSRWQQLSMFVCVCGSLVLIIFGSLLVCPEVARTST